MRSLDKIFAQNRAWAERMRAEDPSFFENNLHQQHPEYLWIGCSDSRVPANQIMGLKPGEVFVHRNVANVVVHTDFNCLSVLQFAVSVLKVKHIIVCGHYGCGGIRAAIEPGKLGIISNWLQHVEDVYSKFEVQMMELNDQQKWDRLCELNVIEQVYNISRTEVVQDAWSNLQPVSIHGLIYSLNDGLLKDLGVSCESRKDAVETYRRAVTRPI
jgi:carbonic anhydrase